MSIKLMRGAFALACALVASSAGAATYRVVDLGEDSEAFAVNRKGEIAGESPAGHAALYVDGAWIDKNDSHHGSRAFAIDRAGDMAGIEWDGQHFMHPMYYPHGLKGYGIPLPGGSVYSGGGTLSDTLMGMSSDGTKIVGTYIAEQAGGQGHCFEWSPGDAIATDLGLPDGYDVCYAYGVNDNGVVVGQLWSVAAGSTAFVYSGGSFTTVGPANRDAALTAINARGHATGTIANANAVRWNGSTFRKIAPSGTLHMYAGTAIDSHDNIAGWGPNGSGLTLLLYSGGTLVDLVPLIDNAAGWDFDGARPTGLSDDGSIVGFALFDDGGGLEHVHGFMLVPDSQ
jgi:hypothetical protein